jgi:glycogen debranching enzyme
MNAFPIQAGDLIEIDPPFIEPRIAYQSNDPRKVNNLTLVDGKTFLSTSFAGDIMPPGAPDVGFFHDDTRFLSHLELKIGGQRAVVLSSSTEKSFASQIELTIGNITLRATIELPENTVHVRREQLLSRNVFFDHLTFENFNQNAIEFRVEVTYAADFMDVFQVRGSARGKHGRYFKPIINKDTVQFVYHGLDRRERRTSIQWHPAPQQITEPWTTAVWEIKLQPHERIRVEAMVSALLQDDPHPRNERLDLATNLKHRRQKFQDWEHESTQITTNHEEFDAAVRNAIGDFHALQIPNGREHIVAAGVPWFATIFGRDSIIASYQSLVLNPRLAVETLRVLARYQGTEHNDWRDEEPGKILHEQRDGEMANHREVPFGAYYGSVDATPLFLVLASEVFNWTADEHLIRELMPALRRAIQWIDQYGDLDGDGLIEYKRRSPKGLINQGWKDSWDAIQHTDGRIAEAPIALAEVQGYVYDAKYRMAKLMRYFEEPMLADRLRREATELTKRIEKSFWMPGLNYFAIALDKDKRKCEVISSNPGHLLFSRALKADKARAVANRLMQPDMHSGWGWRTLSSSERVFNPLSYHRGSIWPHDNSLIAHGMALYDFTRPALHTLTTLFQACLNFRDHRLPELFCGVQRRDHDVPVLYPVSCSPQAWASGALFLMLTSVLGIRPSAPDKELNIVNPALPDWLDHLHIRNLKIGRSRVGLDFTRRGDRTFCNVVDVEGDKLLVNVSFKK